MNGALGILGGMGPLATADFFQKVIKATPAARDQEHIPIFIYSVPQVPDRTESILSGKDEPLTWMRKGIETLCRSGAECIAIPCNTAHYWYEKLVDGLDIPVLHIVDATAASLASKDINEGPIGLLATTGTITAEVYQKRFSVLGYECITPNPDTQINGVTAGIEAVKAGDLDNARRRLEAAANTLVEQNCHAIVLGCTEIPIVLNSETNHSPRIQYLDATQSLAEASVRWHLDLPGKKQRII
ncbi:MAG: hypothetical protein CMF69_12295 [Magnetovibrio sp.]|nr:hypothetical protein [Magnetovibrio sp.]|tara:strand:+ start:1953 stop:2681 length:729 start_codon:yes stop_codon:yes gene_type:complete